MDVEAEDIPPDLDAGNVNNRRRGGTEQGNGALLICRQVSPGRYRDGGDFRGGNRALVNEKKPPAQEDEEQQDSEGNAFLSGGFRRRSNHPLA